MLGIGRIMFFLCQIIHFEQLSILCIVFWTRKQKRKEQDDSFDNKWSNSIPSKTASSLKNDQLSFIQSIRLLEVSHQ